MTHSTNPLLLSNRTVFLKAPSQEAFETAMTEAGFTFVNEEGETEIAYTSINYSFDVIGTISLPTGNTVASEKDGETIQVPEYAEVDGYHVNLRVNGRDIIPDTFDTFILDPQPNTPVRDFV